MLKENLVHDRDVRKLLAVLADSIEPFSAHCHVEKYGDEYKTRYEIYQKELKLIKK
jgi:hypothetical protein